MTPASIQTEPPLSPEQLEFFARNGFLLAKGLVTESERAAVDRDSMALIDKGRNGPFGDKRWQYRTDPEHGNKNCLYRVNQLQAEDMPRSFQMLLAYPPLLHAVSQLMGGDTFAASVHSLVFKLPYHGVPAPWHQDPVKVFRFPVFNTDIYLDAANPDNGGLWVIPGSHLAGYHNPTYNPGFIESWTSGIEAGAPRAIPVAAEPGDVIFHATTLIHGSFWNRSSDLRRTIYFHMDHLEDIRLAGDRWPQNGFEAAHRVTADAIAERTRAHPAETPFNYPDIGTE